MPKKIAYLFVVLLLINSGGCALFDPHKHSEKLFNREYATNQADSKTKSDNDLTKIYIGELANPDFALAKNDASDQRNAYLEAAGTYSQLRNAAPLAAGAVGISTLFLGTFEGTDTSSLTALGLGVASILGISKYYDNQPREDLYYQAANAIDCMINNHAPLAYTKAQYDRLEYNRNKLIKTLEETEYLINVKYPPEDTVWQDNPPEYSYGDILKLISKGDNSLSNANDLVNEINTSGDILRGNVRLLVENVDKEIIKTEPNPNAMYEILNGLGLSKYLSQAAPPQKKDQLQKNSINSQEINGAVDKLIIAIDIIDREIIKFSEKTKAIEKLQSCKPPQAKGSLIVVPEDSVININAGESRLFTVTGGIGIPRIGLSGELKSVTPTIELINGVVQVKLATEKSASGSGTLSIFEGSGLTRHDTTINIISNDATNNSNRRIPNNDIDQYANMENITGNLEKETRAKKQEAIQNLNASSNIEKDSISSQNDDLKDARSKLGLQQVEKGKEIDSEFREAIWNYQTTRQLSKNGILDEATWSSLQLQP